MFARRSQQSESFSKGRSSKAVGKSRRSFRDQGLSSKRMDKIKKPEAESLAPNTMTSPIITLVVGSEARLFACHESVLSTSPYFATLCRGQFLESSTKRIDLPDDIPEVFSSVLEYLYKGDYYPRLLHNKRQNSWELEDAGTRGDGQHNIESTVYHPGVGQVILRDTVIYCTAERFGLDELKRLALRKQGLQSGIQCSTILSSARYAYSNTPDNDSKLRAHYLALIIRSRSTFKRSGTMQMEMEAGGKLFFDLFVALVNHMDDIASITKSPH